MQPESRLSKIMGAIRACIVLLHRLHTLQKTIGFAPHHFLCFRLLGAENPSTSMLFHAADNTNDETRPWQEESKEGSGCDCSERTEPRGVLRGKH